MKRGQAALEFLTTYGFAFIAILIIIGGLNYFGVLDPSSVIPATCKLDAGIGCPSYGFAEVTNGMQYDLDLEIANDNSQEIIVTQMAIKEKKAEDWCFSSNIRDSATDNELTTDDQRTVRRQRSLDMRFRFVDTVTCDMADAGLVDLFDEKKRFELKFYYINRGATKPTIADGMMITAVQ